MAPVFPRDDGGGEGLLDAGDENPGAAHTHGNGADRAELVAEVVVNQIRLLQRPAAQ